MQASRAQEKPMIVFKAMSALKTEAPEPGGSGTSHIENHRMV